MKKSLLIPLLIASSFLSACTPCKPKENNANAQAQIYKNWVLSYCLSKIALDAASKQDALNSASAYLEKSSLPVESFTAAQPLIQKYLDKNYTGSIAGSFNTKKCIDLYQSEELSQFYQSIIQ